MSSLKIIAVAAALSALTATPVFAQAAIQEPGAFAFFHPNLDVLNGGAPTPEARLEAESLGFSKSNFEASVRVPAHIGHLNH
jgi:hypothetical protein